jgi:hypothetical protein
MQASECGHWLRAIIDRAYNNRRPNFNLDEQASFLPSFRYENNDSIISRLPLSVGYCTQC